MESCPGPVLLLPHKASVRRWRSADLERHEAVLFAQRAVALTQAAELWTGQDDPAAPYLALDVAVACQIAQVTASNRMAQARRLVEDLPCTLQGPAGSGPDRRAGHRAAAGDQGPGQ